LAPIEEEGMMPATATKHSALFLLIEDDKGRTTTYGAVRVRSEEEDLWRLIKLRREDSHIEAVYDVQKDGESWSCDCPGATMRPGRGECRHVRGLKEVGVIG
jgi:hypothetical protein